MPEENLLIVQGGGPTAVFNASLASIIQEAMSQPRISQIFGARSGMKGLSTGDLIELTNLTPAHLVALRNSPGASLSSSRFKPTEEDLEHCVEHLRQRKVRHLIFMGGNGTMRGAQLFREFCNKLNFEIQIIGVPKTIDNDIAATDRCPGFASAARFVAQSTLDLAMDIRSLPQPVSIFETLGRDVGWLAAASTLAKQDAGDAPHLVYLPEVPFVRDTFLSNLDNTVRRIGWAVVIVSEGTSYADGTPVFEQKIASHGATHNRPLIGGVAQYLSGVVSESLGIRCRSEKPGLIGRSCASQVSPQDLEDAELVGREGVRALLAGKTDQMLALLPIPIDNLHHQKFELVPLTKAAGHSRTIPPEWIEEDQTLAVTDSFHSYLRPLVGDLRYYPPPLSAWTQ
ncbi:diphosphate--fructose-6-phosphate 1-phosphotransferase [Granulicella sibirica]|uniref:Pyrophosphate--fructose 6-phosphate 1-phosphotransferase n=1 Tax=Granulicella sibirica TaxID=2479048 RepID=A0A4Q0SUA9_9BACT|nr:diphosphate--fructose-6-phosphate 1-phosphotransferase [Granulicella sibirica]RXH54605.1 Pyrophosphate-dependent fructose 6-phosphate-1-kinase [Granulicella sibirica]